jgi:hypothetical protein
MPAFAAGDSLNDSAVSCTDYQLTDNRTLRCPIDQRNSGGLRLCREVHSHGDHLNTLRLGSKPALITPH